MARCPFLGRIGRPGHRSVAWMPAASSTAPPSRTLPSDRCTRRPSMRATWACSMVMGRAACASSHCAALGAYTTLSPPTFKAPCRPGRSAGSSFARDGASSSSQAMPCARRPAALASAPAISSALAAIQSVPQLAYAQPGRSAFMRGPQACHWSSEAWLSASSAALSSITTRWPMPACVAPPRRASSTRTDNPALASRCAQAAPTMPAPMTITSAACMGWLVA